MHRRSLRIASFFLLLGVLPAEAQVVTGRVRSAADGAPIAGAVIRVITDDGAVASGLSGSGGLFRLGVHATGPAHIEVEMIGHHPWSSERVRLGPADSLGVDVRLETAPVELDEIAAESRNLCAGIATTPSGITDVLWRDARTALEAQRITGGEDRLRFQLETFERDITVDSQVVVRDLRHRSSSRAPEGFRAAPIEWLETRGFLEEKTEGIYLYGATPAVLLEGWFVDTHCLGLLAPEPGDSLIGITFTPNRDRRAPEIRGTLNLDARSRDLRSIEFEYVSLPPHVPPGSNGRAWLQRLPDGSVFIREWRIDSPMLELGEILVFGERRPVERVWATRTSGGEVLRARRGSTELFRARRATVEGVVFDSVNRVPLAGAHVFIVGSDFATRTDSTGAYRLEDLPDGTYRLSFEHPRLVAFGHRPAPRRVALTRGDTARFDLGIPANARLLVNPEDVARLDSIAAVGRYLGVNLDNRAVQPDEARRAAFEPGRAARVIVRVVRHEDGKAIAGVAVSLVRRGSYAVVATGVTDANGHLELEGVPGGDYDVAAERDGYLAPTENRATLEPGLVHRMVVRLRSETRQSP